jgi:beta-glucosidase
LDYYRRLVDELRAHDIEPYATLYHWDLPQALQDAGGWPVRDTAYRFADYVDLVTEVLGDGVSNWITLNEPMVAANAGYGDGIHAPGIRDLDASLAATHHLLLGHGLGLAALRGRMRPGSRCGITLNQTITDLASSAPADAAAARRIDGHNNRMYLDPVLTGTYPADMVDLFGASRFAFVREGDLELIGRPIDFLGVNYYRRSLVRATSGVDGQTSGVLKAEIILPQDVDVTAVGWPVQADGLRDVLVHLTKQYPGLPPLMVTENGAAFADPEPASGTVDDPRRIAYLHRHIGATHDALEAGVDVRGYFVWSLVDNFEWAEGYTARFGIVHVDYASQQRTIKSSGRWYGKVARTGTLPDPVTQAEHVAKVDLS